MPAKRSAMRKIKDVLRLKFELRFSHEKIAAATGMSKGAVTNAVQRAVQKGLSWPLPAELDDSRLEALLYAQAALRSRYAQPHPSLGEASGGEIGRGLPPSSAAQPSASAPIEEERAMAQKYVLTKQLKAVPLDQPIEPGASVVEVITTQEFAKLGVATRTGAVAEARRRGHLR